MWVAGRDANPYWGTKFLDNRVMVMVNPSPPVEEVEVILAATGSRLRSKLAHWVEWATGHTDGRPALHILERSALAEVLPRLREALPTAASVVDCSDWRVKQKREQAARVERRKAKREKLRLEREAKATRRPSE